MILVISYYDVALNIALYAALIPILIGLFKIRTFDSLLKVFFTYQVLSFGTDLFCSYLASHGIVNMIPFFIFSALQSLLFLLIFFLYFNHSRIRLFICTCMLLSVFTGYWSVHVFLTETGIDAYLYWPTLVYNLPLIGLSLYLFYRFMVDLAIPKLTNLSLFWINASIFFYFSTTMIAFVFDGLTRIKSLEFGIPIFMVNVSAVFVSYMLAAIVFVKWHNPKTPGQASGDSSSASGNV